MAIEMRNVDLAQYRNLHTWSEFGRSEAVPDQKKNVRIKENDAGVVTVILGWDKDMAVVFKDPTKRKMHSCKRASNDEVAVATSLFDIEVALVQGGMEDHEREVLRRRRRRLNMMLVDLGRPDIVGAMRSVGDYLRTDTSGITRN